MSSSNQQTPSSGGVSASGLVGRRGGGRSNRLPSLRGPRDLTLGGVQKKTFLPNIPVRPKEKKEDAGQVEVEKTGRSQGSGRGKGERGRGGRGRGERGRGRGRGEREVIQSHSIFEQGPTDSLRPKTSGWGVEPVERTSVKTTSIKKEKKDPEETKRILDGLLKDDFVAASDAFSSADPSLVPIKLPLCDLKMETRAESKAILQDVKVKVEPGEDVEMKEEVKPKLDKINPKTGSPYRPKTAAELFLEHSDADDPELLFIQVPDTLPGEPKEKDIDPVPSGQKHSQPSSSDMNKEEETLNTSYEVLAKKLGLVSLDQFSEGYIGKIQVHKSGQTKLVLGNVALDVTLGTPSGFLQDVVSIDMEEQKQGGDMSVLGHVTNKLVCVPDFEQMMDT